MTKHPPNWRRKLIIENNLTQYINNIKISERNKSIVLDYSTGLSYSELSKKYSLSSGRIEEIIQNFFSQLSKNNLYKYWQDPAYISMMMEQIRKEME